MKTTALAERMRQTGDAKWEIYLKARSLAASGRDIIEMTIGEPDIPTPPELVEAAHGAMRSGRTTYSDGRGEPGLRNALCEHYYHKTRRKFSSDQFLCFPGTQTSLFAVMMSVAEGGDEVLVGDPMYATYESVIQACGADLVPVSLRPENGFRISAEDIAKKISPETRALLLTTPHNPTGAILTPEDIDAIARLAIEHDFWIISDEVYDELVFDDHTFHSPLSHPLLADHVIVVSSISKSHAAPGFRSGWCVGPAEFIKELLPLSEAMLFGNQPFIADMTEKAIREGSSVAAGMRKRYCARAALLEQRLTSASNLVVHRPHAGMFAMVNVASTRMSGSEYAKDLLNKYAVAVMPGSSFGSTLDSWVRVALTVEDKSFEEACNRMIRHASSTQKAVA